MRRNLIVILGLMLIGGTASASVVENRTGVHYQQDGGVHADAPDVCEALDPKRILEVDGKKLKGLLIPGDDESDWYNTPTGADLVGERVFVNLRAADGNVAGLRIDVQLPGCGGSVFDPATFEAQREMLASDPKYSETEAPKPGEKTVAAHSLTGYTCDASGWKFVINQISHDVAPSHIRVKWSNGAIENIPASKETPATIVHYRSISNLDQPVWSASVNIFEAWKGRFNLGSGPCNGEATPPPEPFVPPIDNGDNGYFTVVSASDYATQARIEQAAAPIGPINMSCHEFCGGAVDALGTGFGYELFAGLAPS